MAAKFVLGAVCGVAAFAAVSVASAAEDAAATYSKLHRAIVAAERCGGMSFTRDQQIKMADVIDQAVGYDLGAGERLTIIEKNSDDISAILKNDYDTGCSDASIEASLKVFETELKPALGM